MVKWVLLLAMVLSGCGSPLGRAVLPSLPVQALSSRVTDGYMPFIWPLSDGSTGLAVERIDGAKRSVVLSRTRDGRRWDRFMPLLPDEEQVSHPSAITLANGETLMHALVKRQGRYRIAQIDQPLTRPQTTVLQLGASDQDLAPFALRINRTLYLTWTRQVGATSLVMLASSTNDGRTWRPLPPLAPGQLSRMSRLPDGRLLITYQAPRPRHTGLAIHALRVDPASGRADAPQVIAGFGDCHDSYPTAVNGLTACVFIGSTGGPYALYETLSANGRDWSEPRRLTDNGQMNVEPHVVARPGGALLVWGIAQSAQGPYQIHARPYPLAGGEWAGLFAKTQPAPSPSPEPSQTPAAS